MSTATVSAPRDSQLLLRRTLQANGVFCTLCGLILLADSKGIANAFGLDQPAAIIALGVALLVVAAAVFVNSARENISRLEAMVTVIGDFAWVIGSGIVILLGILNTTGNWAVAIVADVTLAFAILEWIGYRRMTRN